MKTKALSLFIFAPAKLGGAEKVVLTGLCALKEIISVKILVIKESRSPENAIKFCQELEKSQIPYEVVTTNFAIDPLLSFKIRNLITKCQKQTFNQVYIHTHGYKALLYTFPAAIGFKLVHTHHGNTSHTFKVRVYEALTLFVMNLCDKVIAVSKTMELELQQNLVAAQNVILIENMISLPKDDVSVPTSIAPDELKLLFAGRLSSEKGILELLSVMKCPEIMGRNIELDIIGSGYLEGQINQFIADNSHAKIRYHGQQLSVVSFLKESDMLVMPSHSEGLPMILLEAASLGVPVIASCVGGIPEVINDEFNGILTEAKNVSALESDILRALSLKAKLTLNCIEYIPIIWRKYGTRQWAQKTANLYLEL